MIVTAGGKQAIYNIVYALAGPGDEVIIPAPYWVSYPEQVRAVGATPVVLEASAEQDFKVSPDALRQAITDRTRLLILNSPSNPTGSVYNRDELTALAEVLVEKKVPVLSDEVYDALIYGEEFVSIASLGEEIHDLTIVSGAVSKTYAMTGWRIGYAVGPAEVIAAAGRLQSHSTSGANSAAQKGALDRGNCQYVKIEAVHIITSTPGGNDIPCARGGCSDGCPRQRKLSECGD